MRRQLKMALVVAAPLAASLVAPGIASAGTISMAAPRSASLYVNMVPVEWSATTTPTALSMVWTCTAGYCLNTVTSPITLDLASTSRSSSFTYNPSAATNANFTNWLGPMPDGTWTVQMKYVDGSGVTFLSPTVTGVQVSTETLPPTLTGLSAGTATNLGTVPVSFTLPDSPSLAVHPTLTFTNIVTAAASVLELQSVASGSLSLDPTNLSTTPSVLGVSGPNDLANGTYDVTLSYQDVYGHAAATTSVDNWTYETTTQPPSLSAPPGGSPQTGRFNLTFALPEAALANSVQLVLTGGSGTITLGLSDTAAGTHTVTIDPTDLAAGSDVLRASASTLPAGSYTASVDYQDALGNPVSGSSPVALTIASPATTTPVTTTSTDPAGTETTPVTTTSTDPATTTPATTATTSTDPDSTVTTPAPTTSTDLAGTVTAPATSTVPNPAGTDTTPAATAPAAGAHATSTLRCRAARGPVGHRRLGRIVLAMHRWAIQRAFAAPALTGSTFDRCSGVGGTMTAGYPVAFHLHGLSPRQRRWVRGRAILLLTTVPSQSIDHMHAGMPLAAARARVDSAHRFRWGHTTWYAIDQRERTVIVSATHGTIRQMGLAAPIVSSTVRQQRLLLSRL